MKKVFLSVILSFCFTSHALALTPYWVFEAVNDFLKDQNAFSSAKTFEIKLKKLGDETRKALLRSANEEGDSLLSVALKSNDSDILKVLIKYGVNPRAVIEDAIIAKNHEAIALIIKAFPKVLDEIGSNDFITFCRIAPYKMIEEKLKKGVSPNRKGLGTVQPLHAAAEDNPDPSVLNLLVDYGAEVDQPAILEHAAIGGNLKIIETLLQSGINVNIRDKGGNTALMTIAPYLSYYICCYRDEPYPKIAAIRGLKALIKAGANVNARREADGDTALRRAASLGRTEVVKILIEASADVNVQDSRGRTPLISATENWREAYTEVIIALLDAGANPNIRDKKGKRAIDYARDSDKLAGTEAFLRLVRASR